MNKEILLHDVVSTTLTARSGLQLYTNAKTGCQYIGAGGSGQIIPRVDASGHHMCGKKGGEK